jgi:type II secretion system (T2SS) protein E
MPRIGELLVAEGVLSEGAVQSALGFQRHTGEPFRLGTILLDRDLLGEESLLKALATIHRCDYVTWSEVLKSPPHIVRLLPERAAIRLAAIPYALEGRGARVAFKNPSNLAAVDEVSALTGRPIVPAVISEVRLLQALHLFYGRPIPIEFRSVLHKLERNEERRGDRPKPPAAAAPSPAPVPPDMTVAPQEKPATPRRVRATQIPISVGEPETPAGRRSAFAAPFLSAEDPQSELDSAELLPDFAPPQPPEQVAQQMWKVGVGFEGETSEPVPELVRELEPAPVVAAPPSEPHLSGRDRIAEAALDSLATQFPRLLLFVSAQESIQGWTARGGGISREGVSRLRIPWGEPSIFAFVKLSGSPHRGGLSRVLMPPAVARLLGPRATSACAVYPVRIKDRLVAFLYADRLGAPMSEDDYRTLEIAASSLGSGLAKLLLELRKASPASSV